MHRYVVDKGLNHGFICRTMIIYNQNTYIDFEKGKGGIIIINKYSRYLTVRRQVTRD